MLWKATPEKKIRKHDFGKKKIKTLIVFISSRKLWRWWRFRLALTMYSVIIVKVYRLKLQRQTPSQKNINVNFRPLVSSDGYYYRKILSVAYFFFLFDPLFQPRPPHLQQSSVGIYSRYADATTPIEAISTVSSILLSCTVLSWQQFRWTSEKLEH